jgi:hypothetical protein
MHTIRTTGWEPPTGWTRAAAIALFVVFALVAAQSARLGISGLWTHLAELQIDHWKSAGQPVSLESANTVQSQLERSLTITANNPWALEKAGALQLARIRAYKDPVAALAATRDARQKFRRALQLRPSSPFLWVDIATAKLYLGEKDHEFSVAMRHADELGHWEPNVQEAVVFAGLAAWPDLEPDLRDALTSSVRRAAARNGRKMFEIVTHFRRYDIICGLSEYNSIGGAECTKAVGDAAKRRSNTKR